MAEHARGLSAQQLVDTYLDQLEGSASTLRQRSWALRDLLDFATEDSGPDPVRAAAILAPDVLTGWIDCAEHDPLAPASRAGLRARASAARALDRFAREHHLLGPGSQPVTALTMVAPPEPTDANRTAARYLLTVAAGSAPWPMHSGVWARFAAHAHLAAATGAGENDLARMTVGDLPEPGSPEATELGDRARLTVDRWLRVRAGLVAELQGTDPGALWLRVHPSTNLRTGAIAPAGLAISARGLRLAFMHMVAAASGLDARVASVRPRDLRALGRDPR